MFLYNLENSLSFSCQPESAPYQGICLKKLNAVSVASLPYWQSALMQSTTCATAHGHLLGISCSTLLRDGCSTSFICAFTLLPSPLSPNSLSLGFLLRYPLYFEALCSRGVCICTVYPTLPWMVASLPYVLDTRFMARTCSVQDDSYLKTDDSIVS